MASDRLLGLIIARGGSKGLPRKNVRPLLGQPMISWTIRAAQAAKRIDRLVISTDDEEIASIARAAGVDVPFLQPEEFSGDDVPSIEAICHALRQCPGFDRVLLLQPTSPLRTSQDIDSIVAAADASGAARIVSVGPNIRPPTWLFTKTDAGTLKPILEGKKDDLRQLARETVFLNGALYLSEIPLLLKEKTFIASDTRFFEMPLERSVDVDTEMDLALAEFLLRKSLP